MVRAAPFAAADVIDRKLRGRFPAPQPNLSDSQIGGEPPPGPLRRKQDGATSHNQETCL